VRRWNNLKFVTTVALLCTYVATFSKHQIAFYDVILHEVQM